MLLFRLLLIFFFKYIIIIKVLSNVWFLNENSWSIYFNMSQHLCHLILYKFVMLRLIRNVEWFPDCLLEFNQSCNLLCVFFISFSGLYEAIQHLTQKMDGLILKKKLMMSIQGSHHLIDITIKILKAHHPSAKT